MGSVILICEAWEVTKTDEKEYSFHGLVGDHCRLACFGHQKEEKQEFHFISLVI